MNPTVEAAIHAFEQGWSPIPIIKGEKRPVHSDWTNTRYKTRNELEAAFSDCNIGLLLGDNSNGLIDIDLDSYHARKLADGFLPATRMIHGRESSAKSHYWYRVDGWSVRTHKLADPTDDEALVEIRGTGGQSLIPPSIHPSGESYEWLGEWHPPTVVRFSEINKQVRWLAAAALLAKHWPGQGQRHDAALALAGGVLNIDNEELQRDAEAFVASVALCAGDEEGFDRQQDVTTTRKKIEGGKKVKGWPSLAKIIDKKVVKQAIEWLTPEEKKEVPEEGLLIRHEFDFDIELKPHPKIIDNILYEEAITWIQGEPDMGKTLFVLWMINEAIEKGYRVLFIDEESSWKVTTERLVMLGAKQDLINERLWYFSMPGFNAMDSEHRAALNEHLKDCDPHLAVFDSAADVLVQSGLSEGDNDDVTRFIKNFLDHLKSEGVAVIVIDHVRKDKDNRGGWARGAGAKKSKTDAAWTLIQNRRFSKTKMGQITLKQAKDRLGELPQTVTYDIGGVGGKKTVVELYHASSETIDIDDKYAKKIVEWLKKYAPTQSEAVVTRDLIKTVRGDNTKLNEATQWLEDNIEETPLAVIEEGGAKKWFYAGTLILDFEGSEDE